MGKFNRALPGKFSRAPKHLPNLSQRGRHWRGRCPLHQGKRASFSVNPTTGWWECFSECGRRGSLIDFEMMLAGVDFIRAISSVFDIVGRRRPERARITREEWLALQNAREREIQERFEILYFSESAVILAEDVLEQLSPCDPERSVQTRLIESLRKDPGTVYRNCRRDHPAITSALVEAGRRSDWRLQMSLLRFIERMAREDSQDAA